MMIFFRRIPKIFVGVISGIVQVANLFVGNIIVYETTEGIKFNWMQLLRSKLFWIVLILTVAYYAIAYAIKQHSDEVDSKLEEAISDNSIKLLNLATENAEKGDFESSEKAIKILDKIQKRRQK